MNEDYYKDLSERATQRMNELIEREKRRDIEKGLPVKKCHEYSALVLNEAFDYARESIHRDRLYRLRILGE